MIQINDYKPEKKIRKVTIHRDSVVKEIDTVTYKYADAVPMQSAQQSDAIASDSSEPLDAKIISSLVAYRDARLRALLSFALVDEETEEVDDTLEDDSIIVYKMSLDSSYRDASLKPLAILIHRYLVYGSLLDWYMRIGSSQASVYAQTLSGIEADILNNVRTPSLGKRPLQPFGPAGRGILI